MVFSKTKTISYGNTYKFCLCVYKLEQFTANLSFTSNLKYKILTLTKVDSSLENLLLKIFSSFWLDPNLNLKSWTPLVYLKRLWSASFWINMCYLQNLTLSLLLKLNVGCLKITEDKSSKSRVQTPNARLIITTSIVPRREDWNPHLNITAMTKK